MPALAPALIAVTLLASPFSAIGPEPPLPTQSWQVVKEIDGIVVRIAPSGKRPPWGAAEGTIAATPEAILNHLLAFHEATRFIPRLKEARVLARNEQEALVYFYLDLPWPISDRDYTARYRWERHDDGSIAIAIEDANEKGPPEGGAVRVHLVRGLWHLSPRPDGTTSARYVSLVDYGGSLASGIVEQTAWKQPLNTLKGVRQALAKK